MSLFCPRCFILLAAAASWGLYLPPMHGQEQPNGQLQVDVAPIFRASKGVERTSSLAFSGDGRYLLAGSQINGEIRIFELKAPENAPKIVTHLVDPIDQGAILLATSPNAKRFASINTSGKKTGNVTVWSLPDAKTISRCGKLFSPTSISFSPDGKTLAVGTMEEVLILDAETCALQKRIAHKEGGFASWLSFAPDGKKLIFSGYCFRRLRLIDVAKGEIYDTMNCPPVESGCFGPVSWSKDNSSYVVVNPNEFISFFRVGYHESAHRRIGPLSDISYNTLLTMTMTRDDRYLALGSFKSGLLIWNTDNFKKLQFENHVLPAISQDGKRLASFFHLENQESLVVSDFESICRQLK